MTLGLFTKLLGGGVSETVKAVADTVDRFYESPDEKTAAKLKERLLDLEQMKLEDRGAERQVEVNKAEAKHASIWVAGWRPAVGWVCVTALFYHFIVYPLSLWGLSIAGMPFDPPPEIELGQLYPLLGGLLGIGAMRSFEKTKGVARSHMKEK